MLYLDIVKALFFFLYVLLKSICAKLSIFLGYSLKKVACWCDQVDPDNLESFVDKRMKGNYQKATEAYIKFLLDTIAKKTEELGYKFEKRANEKKSADLEEKTAFNPNKCNFSFFNRDRIFNG